MKFHLAYHIKNVDFEKIEKYYTIIERNLAKGRERLRLYFRQRE